jgi:integrase
VIIPHTLRHFHAVRALDLGIPLNDLQAQLGHTDLKTTSIYLKADIYYDERSMRDSTSEVTFANLFHIEY